MHGQALVEFALVAPLFFTVLFGIVEFALINASISTVDFAAQDAASLGSLLGRTDPSVDTKMVSDIQSRVRGIVTAKIVKIEIYQSDISGDYILPGQSGPVEDAYDGNGVAIGTAGWPPSARNATLLGADYLGVRITYRYTYLTAFVSGGASALQLVASSVQRIEPQDSYRRAPPAANGDAPQSALAIFVARAAAPLSLVAISAPSRMDSV